MQNSEGEDTGTVDESEISVSEARDEVHRILALAQQKGVVLKLLGGWAVHIHCSEHEFCDREHGDFDFVGLSSQRGEIVQLMEEIGFVENRNMTMSTGGSRMLFERPDSTDHIDIFLDFVDIEHRVVLKERLEIEESTLSVSDLLLMKLTITRLNEKDVRDILTILKDLELGDDDTPGIVNVPYIAGLCARSWGLHHDVVEALEKTTKLLPSYSFSEKTERTLKGKIHSLTEAIDKEPKSMRWRLRAKLGERVPWKREIETEKVTQDTKSAK